MPSYRKRLFEIGDELKKGMNEHHNHWEKTIAELQESSDRVKKAREEKDAVIELEASQLKYQKKLQEQIDLENPEGVVVRDVPELSALADKLENVREEERV